MIVKIKKENIIETLLKEEGCCISSTSNGKPIVWAKTSGTTIIDIFGEEYLDCTSSYGVCGIGYNNEKVINAIKKQSDALLHTMCEIYPHDVYAQAIHDIKLVVGRQENDQIILAQSGSEAVETALKLCTCYSKKNGLIAFMGSYHGQSLGALSVTSHNALRNKFSGIINHRITFVPYPDVSKNCFSSEKELLDKTQEYIEKILESGLSGGEEIGGIIFEPMQNASGYIIPPKGFYKMLRKICDKFNILLIADEIFTGFGRTGYWLMLDKENVVADIVLVGKILGGGMPIAACVTRKEVMAAMKSPIMVALHGGTFLGNALACVAASATIQEIKEKNLVKESENKGKYFRKCLNLIKEKYNISCIIRGSGLASVMEFVDEENKPNQNLANLLSSHLLKMHIITLITAIPNFNAIAFAPPLIISYDELNRVLNSIEVFFAKE